MPINRGPFNALIDDDGSNTVGTVWNKAQIQAVILDPVDAALLVLPPPAPIVQTISGWGAPVGLAPPGVTVLRCTNATPATIQSISAGVDGQEIIIEANGAGRVDLQNQIGAAGTQLVLPVTSGLISLVGGKGRAALIYDTGLGAWRLAQHAQGGPITPTFNAAAYSADTGTWVVDAGDVSGLSYSLDAMQKLLTVSFYLGGTTTTGTPGTLIINTSLFGGLSYATQASLPIELLLPGGWEPGFATPVGGAIWLYRGTHAAFPAVANGVLVRGSLIAFVS